MDLPNRHLLEWPDAQAKPAHRHPAVPDVEERDAIGPWEVLVHPEGQGTRTQLKGARRSAGDIAILRIARQFTDAGVTVAIGHTDAVSEQALPAVDAGGQPATRYYRQIMPRRCPAISAVIAGVVVGGRSGWCAVFAADPETRVAGIPGVRGSFGLPSRNGGSSGGAVCRVMPGWGSSVSPPCCHSTRWWTWHWVAGRTQSGNAQC
jgi:hypothetical protein